jgi:hypothetical protein
VITPKIRQSKGLRVVTPAWINERQRATDELRATRRAAGADTTLIIPAAQHPLEDGTRPGLEFEQRLTAAFARYNLIIQNRGRAKFFLPGNRHYDRQSGQTDQVALYDAAGLWLQNRGVPSEDVHGKDWIDDFGAVYNGADEFRVAAAGFAAHSRFSSALYFCSPGQQKRARQYALAYELPAEIIVPPELSAGEGQFHTTNPLQAMILSGLNRTIDPYGHILARRTQDRLPADGNIGTVPALLGQYATLPWYNGPREALT